ncbi:amino acid permease/ SLC12A domain-containing protein [Ilyonectria robusta]|uniref:amino acid permease/ SLC12A domain-containing protein n=1 Tax=Ilyonectria robusta TaxID=1079257 RepID=UPI001E8DFA7B|nr:amino acid permease/ SLC12A domain-containing protein [Ilyonectria robusta]KAH8667793.1 amino acid permease/ SLC12A domain-containing protein [Ilyonectria robusta]
MLNDTKGASDDALPSKEGPIGRVTSTSEAQIIDIEDSRNGEFQRSFSPRQVHIISLGSNIGSGVFIATGKALANGGPGNMIIAYGLVCSCVWAVLQTLSEMTIAFPTSGNYIDYAGRWVDPALAFGAGFAEWLGWTAVVGAEAVFFNILIKYWSADGLPLAASLTIFTFATLAIFLLPNKAFAWFEYVTSLIKIFLFILIIILSIALVGGAGPTGEVHDGSYWRDLPVFKNGFFGFANCALLAVWAVGDQVFIGIMGGEAESPRYSMAHATKLVPFRVNVIYMLSVIFITLLIPSDDERLLGGSGVTSSPFVLAVTNAGVKGIADLMNACMIIGILAIAAESVYLASRVLRTMAHQKLIPELIARVDAQGRPVWSLVITGATALLLTYLNLNGSGAEVFNWLLSITSASFFMNWIIISFTSWRFHQALAAQNDALFSQVYAWKSVAWPTAPIWLMTISILLLACCLGAGIGDLSTTPFSAYNFFQYAIGILIIVVFTAGYKVIMKTPWRDPKTADLVTGRRTLSQAEITQLDNYYAMPSWRRFLTYIQLW